MLKTPPRTRTCTKCGKRKPLESDFGKLTLGKYGRSPFCKVCAKLVWEKYTSTPEGKARRSEYARRHREKEGYAEKHKSYRETPKAILYTYSIAAKRKGIAFELTLEDVLILFWEKPCHYCGEPLRTAGIDRIDNKLGYTIENTVPCCKVCNMMKNKHNLKDFLTKCDKIALRWPG